MINEQLKNIGQIENSRHLSETGLIAISINTVC